MSAIKINGTWQRVSSIKIKQNGVWNDHTALYARLDGAWHLIDLSAEAQGPAYHVWKAYADDALGNGISLSPEGKEYIGFAVGQRTEEPDLSDPSVFDWSLIKGEDGEGVDQTVLDQIQTTVAGNTNRVSTLENTTATNANRLSTVETETGRTKNRVSSLESTTATQASRLTAVEVKSDTTAGKVDVLEAATSNNASRIETVKVQQDNAVASAIDTAKAYTDTETGVLKAERVIKADANGKVSGIHLLANGSGADAGGKLYFQADEIAIVPPSWNPSTEADKTKFPFYFSEDRSFMYLDEAMIQKLSAETIDSGRLAVDGLTVLSNDISVPAGAIREHMIDPSFKDGIVRVNPDATIQGGTKSVSSTGIGQGKKITVPALESGGSAQTMTISVVGPNEVNRKDVQFDLEMKLNGAPYNFTSGESKIRLSSTITYSTEDGGTRMYRSSFKFEDQVILPAPTKGNEYTYEFIITNMSFSPANTSTYNFADKLKFSISVSEPTVSSGGFITDVRWDEVKEQPSFVALDTAGSSSYPRMFAGNNPASSSIWLRMPSTSGGLLPYSNGNSLLGTSSWKFKEIHSVNFYENGTALSSKYLGKTAKAVDSDKLDGLQASSFSRSDHVHTGLSSSEWGGIRSKTPSGYIDFGPANESYAHIYTDRPYFYFNKELQVLGKTVWHSGNTSDVALKSTTNTFTSSTVFQGSLYVRNIVRIFSSNGACQRVDTRDEGSDGRAHWYGESTTGGTRNFKHAWYDGSAYVNIDVSGQTVNFSGAVGANGGLKQDGHAILNGSDTWLRTKGTDGIYFSSYGGGWRMEDSTWIRAYGNKMLYITNSSTSSVRTTGGVHANQGFRRDNTGSSWISQRDSTVVGVYNATAVSTSSYAAVIRQRHASYTWTVGGLGNYYFGFFAYTNTRTANGTDGYFRMDYRGNCVASGTISASDLIATSDRRVKDNIKVIPDALEKVSKLTGNTYTRNDLDGKPSAGVIAQEVQEVLPEAVTEAEGRLQVAHNGVIGLLVEAVKELKAIVTMQEIEIKQLKGGH